MTTMLLEINPVCETAAFADYLRCLGCTIVEHPNGRVAAFVTFTETVDDDESALAEWCANWSRRARSAVPRQAIAVAVAG